MKGLAGWNVPQICKFRSHILHIQPAEPFQLSHSDVTFSYQTPRSLYR